MKSKSSCKLKIETTTFGNIELGVELELDSELKWDKLLISDGAKKLGYEKISNAQELADSTSKVLRDLVIQHIEAYKTELNCVDASIYVLPEAPPKAPKK